MDSQRQRDFVYLLERVGEPLYFSPRGRDTNAILYDVPSSSIGCRELEDASVRTRGAFAQRTSTMRKVAVKAPAQLPDLSNVARMCPRSALYTYFNPQHRAATTEVRNLLLRQKTLDDLFSMSSACRDSPMVNCKLWINAFASAMLFHRETRNFQLPAIWEVMPDQFFNAFTMRQAFRQAELPEQDRAVIEHPITGRNNNLENRLAYFREDIGINSHHWHWHLIFRPSQSYDYVCLTLNATLLVYNRLDDPASEGRRKGALFAYMHHAMLARYDCERLANNLPRVRPLTIDDNPVLKEGYFGKLIDTNSGQIWGTRQADTRLVDINRASDENLPANFRTLTLADLRKWRDRIMEAIDTGMVNGAGNRRVPLTIDMLGDMLEASTLSPNPQFYSAEGVHNVGHILIAHSHDPEHKHLENGGPMMETSTAMRDPIFYRWHKYIDIIFDAHNQTLQPYQDTGGDFPLAWNNVQVTNINVQTTTFGSQVNLLRTFLMQSHVDLSRGLDFMRSNENNLGSIWLRFTHLNHDPFNYTVTVRNSSNAQVRATVRIYMAPRFNEHEERFMMTQQRKLFIEMDKFVETLRPGENTITRRSTDSTVTIPWEQTFRDLERGPVGGGPGSSEPTPQQAVCGCGWPQHMLLPRGNASGQIYDLVVFLTNAEEDMVARPNTGSNQGSGNNNNCRESLSFCGRLGEPYPDSKPMGYPFDRNPFTIQNPSNPRGPQIAVRTLDEYVSRIPNMSAIQIRIVHDSSRVEMRQDGGPGKGTMREVSGDPTFPSTRPICLTKGQTPPRNTNTSSSSSSSSSSGRPNNMRQGSTSPTASPSQIRPTWTQPATSSSTSSWDNTWYRQRPRTGQSRSRPSSPQSPQGWTQVSRPGSPNWGWGG